MKRYENYIIATLDIDGTGRLGFYIWDTETQHLLDDGLGYPTYFDTKLAALSKIEELIDEKIDNILLVKP